MASGMVPMKQIIDYALKNKCAIGAFTIWSLDSAQAVAEAANELKMPAIMMVGSIEAEFAGGLKNIARLADMAAADSNVPLTLHLDHAEDFEFIRKSIDVGFQSVMIDASKHEFEENVRRTCRVVEFAHKSGVSVEAELGTIGGTEGLINIDDAEALQTDPADALKFAQMTGIDELAVSIGTAHGAYKFPPKLNIPRLKAIAESLSIPLVLHGGSGVPEEQIVAAIEYNIVKINVCTDILMAFGNTYISTQNAPRFKHSVPALFGPSKAAGKELIKSKIKLFGR